MALWLRTIRNRTLLLLLAGLTCTAANGATGTRGNVQWQPHVLTNGSPVLFQINAPAKVHAVSALWMGHSVSFFRSTETKRWVGLAAIPLTEKKGTYELKITETLADGRTAELVRKIRVAEAPYPTIPVTVAKKFTEPSPEELTSISADKELKRKILNLVTSERLWSGDFIAPVSEPVSDIFGTARVFNNEVQSRHEGLDFAAPLGTDVHAINSGVVILARPMFFEGNFVVIDHGQGLLSLYLHLSAFKVKEGDHVHTGETIALSGGTGRATGPHLHLAVRWQSVYLSPAILLKLQIPAR
ncbi:MAG TPA: M23 family metallopeptidase [Terriglobales bacterium]|nr:M23 family metallopeptidase [Terriglobales bacterium]